MKMYHYKTISVVLFLFLIGAVTTNAQSHTFPTFSPGAISSMNTTGVSTAMPTGGVVGEYLVFILEADFTAGTAWSNTIHMEISNGSGLIYKPSGAADAGFLANTNATTLKWSGIISRKYIGGSGLTVRFFDNYNDGSGPYTSNIANVKLTIYKADSDVSFPAISTGTITSGTPGVTVALNPAGISGDHLLFSVEADFTAPASGAWSSTIEMEINNGSSYIFLPLTRAKSGQLNTTANTTLHWTGTLSKEYIGGDPISLRFIDDYHDGCGPYTSSLQNVVMSVFETVEPVDYPPFNVGEISSDNSGTTAAVNVAGITGDQLFFILEADWVGTNVPQNGWSSTMVMEINNGGSTIYEAEARALQGGMDSEAFTTLVWSGSFAEEYPGGTPLSVRFHDDYDDASGPYTSNVSNVRLRTYPAANVSVPIELALFTAQLLQGEIELSWTTFSELNNHFFTIEKSSNALNWYELYTINSRGNSNVEQNYSYTDRKPLDGENYYRLKQTDYNGEFSHSEIELVEYLNSKVSVSPNPSIGVFNFELLTTTVNNTITVFDSQGRKIKELRTEAKNFDLDLSNETPGIYLVNINGTKSVRLLKK